MLRGIEARRGATYDVAGHRVRFLGNAAPTVLTRNVDGRAHVDAAQLAAFIKAIQPGDVVADVGAYRGTYSLIAAACVGERGRVFAFEPTPSNADAIAASVRLNKFEARVVIERAAVSAENGVANFYAWGDATTNSLAHQQSEADTLQVRTISLDEYFANQVPPRVIKIDIEGAELLALRGAQKILASDAFIICELHPYAWAELGYTADDLRALLDRHNRVTTDLITGEVIEEYRYGAVELRKRR